MYVYMCIYVCIYTYIYMCIYVSPDLSGWKLGPVEPRPPPRTEQGLMQASRAFAGAPPSKRSAARQEVRKPTGVPPTVPSSMYIYIYIYINICVSFYSLDGKFKRVLLWRQDVFAHRRHPIRGGHWHLMRQDKPPLPGCFRPFGSHC